MIAIVFVVGMCDTDDLSGTASTGQLPVHRHHEMILATGIPLDYSVTGDGNKGELGQSELIIYS